MPPKGSKQSTSTPALKFTTFNVRFLSPSLAPLSAQLTLSRLIPRSLASSSELTTNIYKLHLLTTLPHYSGKNVAANYVKNDAQGWYSRRSSEQEWDHEREGKRRKLMASEEELEEELQKVGQLPDGSAPPAPKLNVLRSAPEGSVQPAREEETVSVLSLGRQRMQLTLIALQAAEATIDPLAKTIVIHPGSKWLRIGRASDAFPLAIPNIIARKQRNFVPSAKAKGKQREGSPAPTFAPPSAGPPLPALHGTTGDQRMRNAGDGDDDDDDEDDEPAVDPAVPVDPLSAKISSIRGDLRARMRAFKLRGQGNGNSQAMAYNATVEPDATADYNDPGEIEWTKTEGPEAEEVYVGAKVSWLQMLFSESSR